MIECMALNCDMKDKVNEDECDARQLDVQPVGKAAHLDRSEPVARDIKRQKNRETVSCV